METEKLVGVRVAESVSVLMSMRKEVMVLLSWWAQMRNRPVGSRTKLRGLSPPHGVTAMSSSAREPRVGLKESVAMLLWPRLEANTKRPDGWTWTSAVVVCARTVSSTESAKRVGAVERRVSEVEEVEAEEEEEESV